MGGATKILCCYTCDLIEFYGVDFFTFVVCKIYGTSWQKKRKKKKFVPLSNFITKNGVKSVEKKAFLNPSQYFIIMLKSQPYHHKKVYRGGTYVGVE